MPKAGRYEYPTRNLDDCVNYLKKAYDVAKTEVMKREVFADALKMSAKGGGFGLLVGSMAMYGLIETGGGDIRYTEREKIILHGEPKEVEDAKEEAVRTVTLFADIYDRYGANFTDEQLRLFLREKAVVDISEANILAIEVGKLLKKDLQYLRPTKEGLGGGERETTEEPFKHSPDLIAGYGIVSTVFGQIKILNRATLDLARKLLDVVETQITEEAKGTTKQSRGE